MNAYCPRSGERSSATRRNSSRRVERLEPLLEVGRRAPAHGGETLGREALAEHGGIEQERAIRGIERVQPGADQRGEGLRDGDLADVAVEAVRAVLLGREVALAHEHPHDLDREQRHALGLADDRLDGRFRQARHEAVQQLAHGVLAQRLEVHRREAAPRRAPARALVEQLRPRERQDEDRELARPLDEVVDEVERARVRPVDVLEHEDDGSAAAQGLEERPPRPEQLGRRDAAAEAQQLEHRLLHPGAIRVAGHDVVDHGLDLLAARLLVVALDQPGAAADHLAEGPERHALRRRRGSGRGATG